MTTQQEGPTEEPGAPAPDTHHAPEGLQATLRGGGATPAARAGLGAVILGGVLGRFLRVPRRMSGRLRVLGFGLLIAVLSVTTCSFGVDPASLTESYGDPIPTSADAAIRFMEKGGSALESFSNDKEVRLTVTQSEATSALDLGMMLPNLMLELDRIPQDEVRHATDLDALRERIWRDEQARRDSLLATLPRPARLIAKLDPRIRTGDVQIRFQDSGQVVVAGVVQAWRFRQPAMFVVAPRASAGELELRFVEGRLGRLPAPAFIFNALGKAIARGVLLGQNYAEISELSVHEGSLTFAGRVHTPRATR
jgi:hypothetical protein